MQWPGPVYAILGTSTEIATARIGISNALSFCLKRPARATLSRNRPTRQRAMPQRIAAAAELPLVQRQKARLCSCQVGGDVAQVWIDRKARQAAPKGEQWFLGVAVKAVLPHGVLDVLPGERVVVYHQQ